jgi:AcrR family transcriptional regulator
MAQRQPKEEAKQQLSRERVLRAAIELADREGLGALTMRRLAHELGIEAMSLYHYVAGKDDILAGMVDLVTADIPLPDPAGEWKAAIRKTAIAEFEILSQHPWAASTTLSVKQTSESRIRYMDWMLGTLRQAGFSEEVTDLGYHALESHIMGFTLWVAGMNLGTQDQLAATATRFMETFPHEEYPYLVEHIHHHLKPRQQGGDGSFAFGLDLILDGLERIGTAGPGSTTTRGRAPGSAQRRVAPRSVVPPPVRGVPARRRTPTSRRPSSAS